MNPLNLAAKALPTTLNPLFWLALLIWTLLVAAGAMTYGYSEAREAAQLVEGKAALKAIERQAQADAKEIAAERALRRQDREAFDTYRLTQEKANHETNRLVADLRGDVVRLRVPTRSCAPAALPDAGRPAAAGSGDEGHAELSADASVFLVGLLERGNDGIRKHAEVVDRYERLRQACMKERP